MTQESLFTPTPELMQQWLTKWKDKRATVPYDEFFATQAAKWGADQELEACCEWVTEATPWAAYKLRAARRPKPPSLKDEVKQIIDCLVEGDCLNNEDAITLRRALEQLND